MTGIFSDAERKCINQTYNLLHSSPCKAICQTHTDYTLQDTNSSEKHLKSNMKRFCLDSRGKICIVWDFKWPYIKENNIPQPSRPCSPVWTEQSHTPGSETACLENWQRREGGVKTLWCEHDGHWPDSKKKKRQSNTHPHNAELSVYSSAQKNKTGSSL